MSPTQDTTSDLARFFGYVRAFELAQASDDWSLLEPCFAEDAVHLVHHGGPLGGDDHGREAVIAGLRASVHGHDRRFDVRIPEILEGPRLRPDGVWMRYALTLRRSGVPDLRFEGEHLTAYRGERIARIEEWLPAGTGEAVEAHLAEHGAALRAPGSPVAAPSPRDLRDLEGSTARSLVRAYAAAKSQQDVEGALAVCSEDFVLETPAFGTRARSREEAAAQLAVFFQAFPDYGVELEGMADGDALTAWGRARLSLRGSFLGRPPTGKTAELPIFCVFDVQGGAIRGERFFFDRAELCEQLGLAISDLAEALASLRRSRADA